MTLHDLILNSEPLTPWAEGEKIPWDDPEFGARMLSEHLSQNHNAASRRTDKIDQHTSWIHHHILAEMTEGRFRHMPVVEEDALVGIISIGDLVKAKLQHAQKEVTQYKDFVTLDWRAS